MGVQHPYIVCHTKVIMS